jgi:hypothetical protein
MTARVEAAREGIRNVVRMYAPVHRNFSDEATNALNKALAEHEAAVVEANKPGAPPVIPPPQTPSPDLVKLNEPARSEAVGDPTHHPAPVALPPPAEAQEGKTGKGKAK